jgi:hypothetical protein
MDFLMQVSFKFQSSTVPTEYFILAPKGCTTHTCVTLPILCASVEVMSLHGHSGKVTTQERAELKIKYGINMKSNDKVFRLDSYTRYTVMHRDITLMTVSRYVTNQSVFAVPLLQLCEIRIFFFLYVHMYSVGNNTCPLNFIRGYDRVTETYRMMQEALGNSIIK